MVGQFGVCGRLGDGRVGEQSRQMVLWVTTDHVGGRTQRPDNGVGRVQVGLVVSVSVQLKEANRGDGAGGDVSWHVLVLGIMGCSKVPRGNAIMRKVTDEVRGDVLSSGQKVRHSSVPVDAGEASD